MGFVGLYVRVSTDEQANFGLSIETQKQALLEFAQKNNLNVFKVYEDHGFSATKLKRPALQEMLNDIEQGKIKRILITKLDRLNRGVKNYYKLNEVFEKHKVDWQTIFEDYNTTSAAGRLHINIMLSIAENESSVTSERIKAVFKHKLANHEFLSGNICLGYKLENKKLVVDHEESKIIKAIFDFYEDTNNLNKTVQFVANNFEAMTQTRIKRILKNSLYKGVYKNEIEDFCEKIISTEQFDKVQELLKLNVRNFRNKKHDTEYIFTGILKCKFCGNNLTGNRIKKFNQEKGQYIYHVYKCQNAFKNHQCLNTYSVPEINILEKYLINNIINELECHILNLEPRNFKRKHKNNTNTLPTLKKRLERLKTLFLNNLIELEEYKHDYNQIQKQISELEKPKNTNLNTAALVDFKNMNLKEIYKTLNPTEKRKLWLSVIDHVEIGNNRNDIKIFFK